MRASLFAWMLTVLGGCQQQLASASDRVAPAETAVVAALLGRDAGTLALFDREGFRRGKNGVVVEGGHIVALRLRRVGLAGMAHVAGLPGLEELDLADNAIGAIEGLQGAARLEVLSLRDNKITSLAGLGGCRALRTLDLTTNALASTAELAPLPSLRELMLANNKLLAAPGLAGRAALELLNLSGNQLASAQDLHDLSGLRSLVLSRNRLTTLDGLRDLPLLAHLSADDNLIVDATAASALPSLKSLDLRRNKMVERSPQLGAGPEVREDAVTVEAEPGWVPERPKIRGGTRNGWSGLGKPGRCTVGLGGALACRGSADRLTGTTSIELIKSAPAARHAHVQLTVARGRVAVYLRATDQRGGFRLAVAEPGRPASLAGFLDTDASNAIRLVLSALDGEAEGLEWDVRSGVGLSPR